MGSPQGSVLLLGGTGKVARHITPILSSAGIATLVASRSGTAPDGHTGVRFDWHDKSTWDGTLAAPGSPPVRAVFIVAPYVGDPGPLAAEFIDLARAKRVRRFVLLSASLVPDGGPAMGQIHKYLRELGDKGELEWAVLRPTWFQGL
jgi:festuclavine dehydrogenase